MNPPALSEGPTIDTASGWCREARRLVSPNCDARPDADEVLLIVVHAISLPPGEFGGRHIDQLFLNALDPDEHPYFASVCGNPVSAHFLIDRTGALTQYVSVRDRAWHAGVSEFEGRAACNDFSVGIELEGCDEQSFPPAQYGTLVALSGALITAYPGLAPERVVGHCDIAPRRKIDPGPAFDWDRYRAMLAVRLRGQGMNGSK